MNGTNDKPDRIRWSPIAPLGDYEVGIDFGEIDGLRRQWLEVKERVESSTPQAYSRFNEELSREWAIETGIIEGLYELDRGTAQELIENGFCGEGVANKPSDEIITILNDHMAAIDEINAWVEKSRPLTVWFIRNLHQAIARNQPTYEAVNQFGRFFDAELRRGAFKSRPNNPTRRDGIVHEYCPPEQVDSEMDNLVKWYACHDADRHHPLTVGAWLHHRFTQIHPFEDGNGRVARGLLLTWHLVRKEYLPVVVTRDIRSEYIGTLERADAGDIAPFAGLLVRLQKGTLLRGLALSQFGRRCFGESRLWRSGALDSRFRGNDGCGREWEAGDG